MGLFACTTTIEYKAPLFKRMESLKGDTLVRDVMCTEVRTIDIIDSLLVLQCANSIDKKAFYLYSKNTGKLLKTFGIYGNGPGELPKVFEYTFDPEKKIVYVIGNAKILSFSLDSVLQNDEYRFDSQISLNTTTNHAWMFYLTDSLFLSMNDMRPGRDYRLAILNSHADILAAYKEMPPINKTVNNDSTAMTLFYLMRTLGAMKPDGKKFVVATTCGLNMEIFNISETKIEMELMRRFVEPKFVKSRIILNDGVIPGLIRLYASDKYIYGMWSEDTDKLFAQEFVTFDWAGNPISRYYFGPGMVGSWAIENDSIAYITIKDSEGRQHVVRYGLL